MSDRLFLAQYLEQFYDELEPKEFYRAIFPVGELEESGRLEHGKYNSIAVELLPKSDDTEKNALQHIITDGLELVDKLIQSDNFIIVSPISYAGRSRKAAAARFIYAIAIDLDGVTKKEYIENLFYQTEVGRLPQPTYTVFSGTGLHLYYKFTEPLPCFNNITSQLAELKKGLTQRIWNDYVTELHDKPQIQSLFQGFRMVGTATKGGNRVRAFATGKDWTIDDLNEFVAERYRVKDFAYKSTLTKAQAKEKYPDWYENRIVKKQPKGTWTCKKDLYEWWKKRVLFEAKYGHRYYSIMCLCVYAKKCGIERKELEKDAFLLQEQLNGAKKQDEEPFTREDVLAALEMYNDNYITFPIHSIVDLTDIPIERNKRNYRPQEVHIKLMNNMREFKKSVGEPMQIGRPKGSGTKEELVKQWRQDNPNGNRLECAAALGISRNTAAKYWDC